MFDYVEEKIQDVARILFGISVLCSVVILISGFNVCNHGYKFDYGQFFIYVTFVIYFLIGSYIGSLFMCGFGDIVYYIKKLDTKVDTIEKFYKDKQNDSKTLQSGGWECSCGKINASYVRSCSCGKPQP